MWTVSTTPTNYFPPNGEEWCIIDEDGDIHDFYSSREEAEVQLEVLLGELGFNKPRVSDH